MSADEQLGDLLRARETAFDRAVLKHLADIAESLQKIAHAMDGGLVIFDGNN